MATKTSLLFFYWNSLKLKRNLNSRGKNVWGVFSYNEKLWFFSSEIKNFKKLINSCLSCLYFSFALQGSKSLNPELF